MLQGNATKSRIFYAISILRIIAFLLILTSTISPPFASFVFAQSGPASGASANVEKITGLGRVGDTIELSGTDIRIIIAKIIRAAFGLLGIVALILVIYAGFLWMTSGGNTEQVEKAKMLLRNWAIGMAIIFSAFAIVQFIIVKLGAATGLGGEGIGRGAKSGRPPLYAGALGTIIQDHYPERNARNIPRNTRIMVTFKEAMNPASMIIDSNGPGGDPNGVFGDCVRSGENVVCDKINAKNVLIGKAEDEDGPFVEEAEATMTLDKRTFVFKPKEPLGSSVEPTRYRVNLGEKIEREKGEKAFSGAEPFYEWTFVIGTTLDLNPPFVQRFSPSSVLPVPKNTLAQITFNEAMDPTFISGHASNLPFVKMVFAEGRGIEGSPSFVDYKTEIPGRFEISNGYRTITFVPDNLCGENTCGEPIYCFPGNSAILPLFYTALIKNAGSPESLPLSGVVDAAGNSLDGGGGRAGAKDNIAQGAPADSKRLVNGYPDPSNADFGVDNFFWIFKSSDNLDLTPPKVLFHSPDVEEENISRDVSSTIKFSEEMMYPSVIQNSSISAQGGPWGYFHRFEEEDFAPASGASKTRLDLKSAELLPANEEGAVLDIDFATRLMSNARDLAQNCFYPSVTEFPIGESGLAACGLPQDLPGRIGRANPSCCNGNPISAESCEL